MPKYEVTISRKEVRTHVFEVIADTQEQAEELAYEESCNYNWHDSNIKHADEDIIGVKSK